MKSTLRKILHLYGIRHIGQYGRSLVIRQQLKKLKFTHVLDAGCGTGLYSKYISARFPHARIVALDLFDNSLEAELKTNPRLGERIVFLKKDLTKMTFSNRFDLIVNVNALGMTLWDYRDIILKNFYKALKPGGILLMHSGKGIKIPGGYRTNRNGELLIKEIRISGFEIDAVKNTFGSLGALAWDIFLLVDKHKLVKLIVLPLLKIMVYCDSKIDHKIGNGLFIVARKPAID